MRPSSDRRLGRAVLTLIAILAVTMAVATPASAATKRTASLKLSAGSVVVGTKVVFTGKVTKSPKGSKVRIERFSAKKWRSVKTVKTTNRKGAFRYTMATTAAGVTKYRVVAPASKARKKATSKARTLRVNAKSVAPTPPVPVPAPVPMRPLTTMVKTSSGALPNSISGGGVMSADGNYVAFTSLASNLVSEPTNFIGDVYLANRTTGEVVLVSRPYGTNHGGGDRSDSPTVSADGRYVTYRSRAGGMAPAVIGPGHYQVYLWDRLNPDETILISANPLGGGSNGETGPPSISADGNRVVFNTAGSNLVSGDTNNTGDVFLWTRGSGLQKITHAADGGPTNGPAYAAVISADGRYLSFTSDASNLISAPDTSASNVYVWDRLSPGGEPLRVSNRADGSASSTSYLNGISADGRFVTFESTDAEMVSPISDGSRQIFVWDRSAPTVAPVLVSRGVDGAAAAGDSRAASISGDGRYVAYYSEALNIVSDDPNAGGNVFVWDRTQPTEPTVMVSRPPDGSETHGVSYVYRFAPALSSDGRFIAFDSNASNLVDGDTNELTDVFVWDRQGR